MPTDCSSCFTVSFLSFKDHNEKYQQVSRASPQRVAFSPQGSTLSFKSENTSILLRPRGDPITPRRFPPAQTFNLNRVTYPSIELHAIHPLAAPAAFRQRPSFAGFLLRPNQTIRRKRSRVPTLRRSTDAALFERGSGDGVASNLPIDGHSFRRVEVLTGTPRPHRWSMAEKAAIVAESLAPRAVASEIALRWGLHRATSSTAGAESFVQRPSPTLVFPDLILFRC